jgi:hypothetical protein
MSRTQRNPWIGITYIPDNPRMETPPAWFLQQIHDFDAYLVLLPSRLRPFAYVLARRRQLSAGLTDKAVEDSITVSDTKMCLTYGCMPVCLIFKTGPTWDADRIIRSLRARDLWAHGGADRVADMLEAQEDAEREKLRQEIRDDMWNRSGDAWRSYQARTGQRVSLNPTTTRTGRRAIPTAPSGSIAGSGALFTSA